MPDKPLDVICLGRVAVDLYGEQIGGRLEDMQSFAKYVGGSSGNMAIGMARHVQRARRAKRTGWAFLLTAPMVLMCWPLRQWPGEHVAKCLVFYDVDDDAVLQQQQERQVATLYKACVANGREMLLEVVPPAGCTTTAEKSLQMLERFYDIGVFPDWWKLPQQSARTWDAVCEAIHRRDPHCRGIVILGFDAPLAELAQSFHAAAGQPLIKGFAIGRSIFSESARAWFGGSMDDDAVIRTVADNFASVIEMWHRRNICPAAASDTERTTS